MIVSTCSFGSTGSSAVSDYLKECENTQVLDKFEFTIASEVDGLVDLAYHLVEKNTRQSSSIYAIQRFQAAVEKAKKSWVRNTHISADEIDRITERFLDGITQVKYTGMSPRIYKGGSAIINRYLGEAVIIKRIIRPLEKKGIIKRNLDFYPLEEVRFSSHPQNFYQEARQFLMDLLSGMGADFNKIVVLDQAFSGSDPETCFDFYDNPYAVVVDRDPRDIFIFAKKVLLSRGRFMPTYNVEDFIKYYRGIRNSKNKYTNPTRCMSIQFEEMVYEYESAAKRIDTFLNVKNNNRKTIFIPEMSIANTNLAAKFPEYSREVSVIERELPEFLFDFSKYPTPSNAGKMFFGKSPLNK